MVKIRELMTAFGPNVSEAQPLGRAHKLLRDLNRDYLTVIGRDEHPVGFITHADVEQVKQGQPEDWTALRCGSVLEPVNDQLDPDDEVDVALELLICHGVRPLLVREKNTPVGVIEPTVVFQWCAEHRPEVVDKLAHIATQEERSPYPDSREHTRPGVGAS